MIPASNYCRKKETGRKTLLPDKTDNVKKAFRKNQFPA